MLSETQRVALLAYIDLLRGIFRLDHWEITVQDYPAAEGKDATIRCVADRYLAHLCVGKNFFTLERATQCAVIAHELIHIHHTQIDDAVMLAEKHLGATAYTMLWDAYVHADEYATDALAAVLVPFLPLPDLPKD